VDPKEGERIGLSSFDYCSNNPINKVDLDGMKDHKKGEKPTTQTEHARISPPPMTPVPSELIKNLPKGGIQVVEGGATVVEESWIGKIFKYGGKTIGLTVGFVLSPSLMGKGTPLTSAELDRITGKPLPKLTEIEKEKLLQRIQPKPVPQDNLNLFRHQCYLQRLSRRIKKGELQFIGL
jgi:hypothetical protein